VDEILPAVPLLGQTNVLVRYMPDTYPLSAHASSHSAGVR
jgi:hypothetical protein